MKKLLAWAGALFVGSSLAGACGGSGSDAPGGGGDDKDASGADASLILPDGGKIKGCQQSCADLGASCGPQGDGCGNVIDCGTCAAPEVCGAGGPSKCGNPNPSCKPKTCADLGAKCGPQGDGCGKVIQCGSCPAGQTCGGGGLNTCGVGTTPPSDAGACVPKKTACVAGDCGPIGDGCGKLLQCGVCTAPDICGGGLPGRPGTPSRCGGGTLVDGGALCTPKTCQQLGKNCGPVADGCGKLLQCGSTCPGTQICGGGGIPSVCGPATAGNDAGACTGLCLKQVDCPGAVTTTVSGTVYAPNGLQPLPNAVIYVPNGGVAPYYGVQVFSQGVACNRCGADVTGSPLVKTTSAFDGTFTLQNVPVGTDIPIVIQLGRWRRMTTINVSNSCGANPLAALSTRLPRTQAEFGVPQNNIPLTAIATGSVDTLECVIRKIGVADSEFTSPSGSGRIQMWRGDLSNDVQQGPGETRYYGAQPPVGSGPVASWSGLYGSAMALARYDQLIFSCNGDPGEATMNDGDRARVRDYLNAGGRLLASHYEYVWLNAFAPFSQTARWNVDQRHPDDPNAVTGDIDTSFAKGQTFASWLGVVSALSSVTPPKIAINVSRHDIDGTPGTGITSPAQRWISVDPVRPNGSAFPAADGQGRPYTNYVGAPQHYTFNTPWGVPEAQQCGRVLFSDFHVSNAQVNSTAFPLECDNNPLTPQEKVIEFMLFDLGNCITPDAPPPSCTPRTCQQLGIQCGPAGNGCGGVVQCGDCTNGLTCGGGGTPNQCGGPTCTPRTCTQLGALCGSAGDGCGNTLDCGGCPTGQACGAGGVPNKCAVSSCTPRTCAQMGVTCGPSGNGCGALLDCGKCSSNCTPRTCSQAGANCGKIGDNCGNLIDCGVCTPPATCGGNNKPNVCGIPPGGIE